MPQSNALLIYKNHLLDSYKRLLEKSNEYRFIDESKSDYAAFKAMKVLGKLNKLNYLQH